jgi:hypothetical protein
MYNTDPSHEDVKLNGPFLLRLIQIILCLKLSLCDVPNAKYEEVEFKFEKSILAGEMNGKTYMIKGTIDGKPLFGVVKMLNLKSILKI